MTRSNEVPGSLATGISPDQLGGLGALWSTALTGPSFHSASDPSRPVAGGVGNVSPPRRSHPLNSRRAPMMPGPKQARRGILADHALVTPKTASGHDPSRRPGRS